MHKDIKANQKHQLSLPARLYQLFSPKKPYGVTFTSSIPIFVNSRTFLSDTVGCEIRIGYIFTLSFIKGAHTSRWQIAFIYSLHEFHQGFLVHDLIVCNPENTYTKIRTQLIANFIRAALLGCLVITSVNLNDYFPTVNVNIRKINMAIKLETLLSYCILLLILTNHRENYILIYCSSLKEFRSGAVTPVYPIPNSLVENLSACGLCCYFPVLVHICQLYILSPYLPHDLFCYGRGGVSGLIQSLQPIQNSRSLVSIETTRSVTIISRDPFGHEVGCRRGRDVAPTSVDEELSVLTRRFSLLNQRRLCLRSEHRGPFSRFQALTLFFSIPYACHTSVPAGLTTETKKKSRTCGNDATLGFRKPTRDSRDIFRTSFPPMHCKITTANPNMQHPENRILRHMLKILTINLKCLNNV